MGIVGNTLKVNNMILEDLDNKTKLTHNINIKKLYDILSSKEIKVFPQNDNASKNAKKGLPELCFSRSDMKPQYTGEIPSQDLRLGQMIKVEFNMEKLRNSIRGLKKPYPVSYGNANPDKSLGNTEMRGEERIQINKIPVNVKYMTIWLPDNLFKEDFQKIGPIVKDRNQNVKNFMKEHLDFKKLIDDGKKSGLIKEYKDTSRTAYNKRMYFDY